MPEDILKLMAHLIIVQWAQNSAMGAEIANLIYGYRGKSACYIIPSAPLLETDQIIKVVPRVIEGEAMDATTEKYAIAQINTETPLGWSALYDKGEDTQQLKGSAGATLNVKLQYILFKNWSHNRSRTVRLDIIAKRSRLNGRRTS